MTYVYILSEVVMLKSLLFVNLFLSIFLFSCGSSTKEDTPEVPQAPQAPQEPILTEISCSGQARLKFNEAFTSDDNTQYPANNVIDSIFMTESRWSTTELDQSLILELETASLLKGIAITWLNSDNRTYSYDIELSKDNIDWTSVISAQLSDETSNRSQYIAISETTTKYVKIITRGNNIDNSANIIEAEAFGCHDDITSSIELNDWYLSIPVDEAIQTKAKSIYEKDLNDDYFHDQFFFSSVDNGLVFRAPVDGAKTSTNTKYTRTELREMLRSGNTNIKTQGVNKNNWVFSSAPQEDIDAAGGVDGDLDAELSVNHVTTTGVDYQIGRVIIGQIHANSDEPIRIYYRKLPQNVNGSIYMAHEINGGDDIYYELIGSRSSNASNPIDGIKLNERFGYNISVHGNQLSLTIHRPNKESITQIVDMNTSGYDVGGQYMYFKAGVYNQNNTGDPKDYVQATFYEIDNNHD
jgi:poly(beta-D-mannuronate) lyase